MDGTNTGPNFPIPIPGVAKVPGQGAEQIETKTWLVFLCERSINTLLKNQ